MKLATEDNPQPPVDDFLALLVVLWKTGSSVNLKAASHELNVYPAPKPELMAWILKHFETLEHWLPGDCDACVQWCMERIEAYWGAHPHLCFRCTALAVSHFELNGVWPEATWYKGEERCGEVD